MRPRRKALRNRSGLRRLVRGAAFAALGAAVAVPLARHRLKLHPAITLAAVASAPVALAVLRTRTRRRDTALFALQQWAFTVAHELPYDDPDGLRRRLRVHYPIRIDRALGGGELPNRILQRKLGVPGRVTSFDRALTWVHWLWFLVPHAGLVWILIRDNPGFARAARQMAATYDIGCLCYALVPTAPPWWASEQGYTGCEVRRLMVPVGEQTWGGAWPLLYGFFGGNPWAAMPSLHFGSSVLTALLLAELGPVEGAVGWTYALTLGFALVYLGEHYVTDLAGGLALVAAVRRGEPIAEPYALALSRAVQRLERLAAA